MVGLERETGISKVDERDSISAGEVGLIRRSKDRA